MKIVIACNHSWPHTGGSEKVVQQIAESSANRFGHDVVVLSRSLTKRLTNNKVTYEPCGRTPDGFVKQLQKIKPDHTHVYSDCFTYWGDLLQSIDKIPGTTSIALVGMNHMRESARTMKVFLREKEKVSVITHSDNYLDYQKCQGKGIPVTVIPNAVDLDEFDKREVQNLTTTKEILCVANFFPGKGQDHLARVLDELWKKRQDFKASFVFTDTNFGFGKILESQTKKILDKSEFPYKFHRNLPREKVIGLFKKSSVFAFPSQKEVAPLVGIESQAARLPWVSLPVGNMRELVGGVVVPHAGVDGKGYCRYSQEVYGNFASAISEMLDNGKEYAEKGRSQVEEKYCWEKVAHMYNEVFER